MHDVQHISIFINRKPADVYEFASNPENLPLWAAGLAQSEVRREKDEWGIDSPFGKIWVKFAEDKTAIKKDLKALKNLLERNSKGRDLYGKNIIRSRPAK